MRRATTPVWLLAPLLLIVYLLYQPGLSGGFVFDDGGSITENEWIKIDRLTPAALQGAAGSFHGSPFGRPLVMLTFALDHLAAGLDPAQFKRTNLLIHLANGGLLFVLAMLILEALRRRGAVAPAVDLSPRRIRWLALLVTALWLLHPLALTSVLYVVQRMTSLAALFSLVALALYLWGRLRLLDRRAGWPLIALSLGVATPLAVLSKENALLIPLFLLLVEWLILGFSAPAPQRRRLSGLFTVLVGLPALAVALYLLGHPALITGGYAGRPFSLAERVMTEGRVLWFYLRLIVLPSVSQMGLFHDDFPLSRSLFDPWITLPALVGLVALVLAALWWRRRAPLFAFGVLFFCAGHLMESTVFPLEIAHEHRNYLPMIGILLAVAYYATHPTVVASRARMATVALLVALLAQLTWVRVGLWSDPWQQSVAEATYHPDSPRAQFELGRSYFLLLRQEERASARALLAEEARARFTRSYRLNGLFLAGLFGNLLLADELGEAQDPELVARLERHLREQTLSADTVNLLHQLSRARLGASCSVDLALIARLYRAALDNPTLVGRHRSMLLSEVTVHALMVGDFEAALVAAREALAGDRTLPQYWLNYANLLIRAGRLAEAERLLEEFGRTSLARWNAARLSVVEQRLREARMGDELSGRPSEGGRSGG
ncbi:tetratricopeptide repeat protein [Endothiovibrio diazotrophicus]